MPQNAEVGYTVQAVATRLGIATPTLRSWNRRYGIGPSDHLPGRHRQYSETDIARLVLMVRLIRAGATPASAARASAAGAPAEPLGAPDDFATVLDAAFHLDGDAVRSILTARLARDGVCATWQELCRPLFAAVLDRRTETDQCIDVEHLLSNATSAALAQVRSAQLDSRPPVLLACTPNETHTLALEALRAAMAECGLATTMIGGAVPPAALSAAIQRVDPPRAVLLWSHRPETAKTSAMRAPLNAELLVVAGGPGWDIPGLPIGVRFAESLDGALALFS
ncbi:MerR family transcriptional regulator [Aldersonia kunmingensis]|uniref:MerR family transcriptional regulator n=1 Tax=Aldersonia kunmingensis TaxID=408066 RepID=UPI0008302662|nr:MerR family transcriptional regulator [Aldersonia kunmingensis]